jgi:hypothetical protein
VVEAEALTEFRVRTLKRAIALFTYIKVRKRPFDGRRPTPIELFKVAIFEVICTCWSLEPIEVQATISKFIVSFYRNTNVVTVKRLLAYFIVL